MSDLVEGEIQRLGASLLPCISLTWWQFLTHLRFGYHRRSSTSRLGTNFWIITSAKEVLFSSPPVCLLISVLAGLSKYYWLDLPEKNQKMGLGPTYIPLNFESDLDHPLDKNISTYEENPNFPIYLLIRTSAEVFYSLNALALT